MKLENSLFIKLLGDSQYIRVLDFLLTYREFDYSKKEIAENANVSYNTLNSFWKEMLNNGIIIKTRRIGKQDMFKLEHGLINSIFIKLFPSIASGFFNAPRTAFKKAAVTCLVLMFVGFGYFSEL